MGKLKGFTTPWQYDEQLGMNIRFTVREVDPRKYSEHHFNEELEDAFEGRDDLYWEHEWD